jgi:hypothetical protein
MAYNNFTLASVKEQFGLSLSIDPFCQGLPPAAPSATFEAIFAEWLPIAQQAKSEKAKSELLVSPILLEVRKLVSNSVELFSGEEFSVDKELGLNGFCDFLLSKSLTPYIVEAPVIMLVEAKKGELDVGLGQLATQGSEGTSEQSVAICVAEVVAAQLFNQAQGKPIETIYGCVTSGKLWQFLKLKGKDVAIDANEYQVTPVEKILDILKWMVENT